MKIIKTVILSILILILTFIIGSTVPINLLSYISADLIICNESELDIWSIESDYFYIRNIEKWECRKVEKTKILTEFMRYDVIINIEWEDSIIYENGFTDTGWFWSYEYYFKKALLIKDRKLIIRDLVAEETINSMERIWTVRYEFR